MKAWSHGGVSSPAMSGSPRIARLVVMAATAAGTGTGTGTAAGHKRPHPEPAARIGTHDGTFHCDEALACFLLRLLPRYRVRSPGRERDGGTVRCRVPGSSWGSLLSVPHGDI